MPNPWSQLSKKEVKEIGRIYSPEEISFYMKQGYIPETMRSDIQDYTDVALTPDLGEYDGKRGLNMSPWIGQGNSSSAGNTSSNKTNKRTTFKEMEVGVPYKQEDIYSSEEGFQTPEQLESYITSTLNKLPEKYIRLYENNLDVDSNVMDRAETLKALLITIKEGGYMTDQELKNLKK